MRFVGPNYLSQPALGWLKVCYDVDKHLSLPSSFGCQLVFGYFRGGERRRDESYPSFRCKFGGRSLLLCFWFSLRGVVLSWLTGQWGRLQPRFPVELRRRQGM
jgi:hypothetical protein